MSGKQNSLRRNFGVKQKRDKAEDRRIRYTRPEGSTEEIGRTHAGDTGHTMTMAPKRWEERRSER